METETASDYAMIDCKLRNKSHKNSWVAERMLKCLEAKGGRSSQLNYKLEAGGRRDRNKGKRNNKELKRAVRPGPIQ